MSTGTQYYTIITAAGLALEAQAKVNNTAITIAKIAVGDGNGAEYDPDESQVALRNEKWRGNLNALRQDTANANWWITEAILPDEIGGFYVREVAYITDTNVVYAIGKYPSSYKPVLAQGSNRQIYIRGIFQTGNATQVTLLTDPSIVVATKEDLLDYAAPKNHTHSVAQILPGGLVQQILRKKSNLDGDVEWVDPTEGVSVNVNTIEESLLLAANQTIVDLVTITTNGVVLYIGGGRLDKDDFNIVSQTRLSLKRTYPANTKLTAAQNEVAGTVVNPLDSSKNLSDVKNAAAARKNLKASASLTGTPQKWPTLDCPDFAVVRDGSALSRLVYPELFAVLCPFRTATITQNAAGAVVTGLSRTRDMWVGMPVEHAAIPAGATVKSIDSAAQVTLSVNSTATVAGASVQLFFHGYGNGGNAATFGVMDDRGLFDRALDSGERAYEKSTITGTTNSTTAVTGIASTRGAFIGQPVSGPGLQAGTTVAGITATGVTLSLAATTSVAGNLLIFTGGQVGNERSDTAQGHWHASYVESQHGYSSGGVINDYMAVYPQNAAYGSIRDPITDGTNGTPRTGPETRPRFRDWLPIIII